MVLNNRNFDSSNYRPKGPEWGSETGVEGKQNSRLIFVSDLHNFRRLTHLGFNFYVSIIDTKHPKYVRTTDKGVERWRMRFNVFSTGFFAQWRPNTLLHIGELHAYYDLIVDRSKSWCDDFTFYFDLRNIGVEIIPERYKQMEWALKDSLRGSDRMKFLLHLPIERSGFLSPNKDLDDFLERQDVILIQLEQMKAEYQRNKPLKGAVSYIKFNRDVDGDIHKKRPVFQKNFQLKN